MDIQQFRYSNDNLGYLVWSKNRGMAIDGGAADEMIAFAQARAIEIRYVTNTHLHQDHVCGNPALLKETNAQHLDCSQLEDGREIRLDDEIVKVLVTPGHSRESVCFAAGDFLVTGDTLFNGTVGNCFSGDLDGFFRSLKRLMAYPGTTRIFAGHDYVKESMDIAASIDPDNPDIKAYMDAYDPGLVVSTLADETKVNPYIRFNAPNMLKHLQQRNVPFQTEAERFKSIMEIF